MKTVLIVEDEKMIRQGIKTMIMRSGVPIETIMECNNGETALEILKEQEIDVYGHPYAEDGWHRTGTENAEPRTYSTYRGNQWL